MKNCFALFIMLSVSSVAWQSAQAADATAGKDTRSLEQKLLPPDNIRLPPSNALRTASGLRYVILKRGSGKSHPVANSEIEIDYTGWDFQGRMFDSSLPRGKPSQFQLTNLIKGWQEGVLLMSPGDTFRFWIPGALAYDGGGGDAPKGKLVFDITLYDFK